MSKENYSNILFEHWNPRGWERCVKTRFLSSIPFLLLTFFVKEPSSLLKSFTLECDYCQMFYAPYVESLKKIEEYSYKCISGIEISNSSLFYIEIEKNSLRKRFVLL